MSFSLGLIDWAICLVALSSSILFGLYLAVRKKSSADSTRFFWSAAVSPGLWSADARMSGTAFGTVLLHVSPEAAAGGPLALVHNGDMMHVPGRQIQLDVDDATLSQRRREWTPPPGPKRGWAKLYFDHVLPAQEGADLDFLVGSSGAAVPRDSH